MAIINARLSIRSSNLFKNSISQRHDRTFRVETSVDNGTRLIKNNSSGSPFTLVDGTEFFDSTESGALANQILVFIRNTTLTTGKTITVQFNDGSARQDVMTLGPGEYALFPYKCASASEDLEVFSNDAAGVRIEFIVSPMK